MKLVASVALLLCFLGISSAVRQVYRLTTASVEESYAISEVAEGWGYDVFAQVPLSSGYAVDILVDENSKQRIADLGKPMQVLIEDIDILIGEEKERIQNYKKDEFFEEYQDLDSIYAFITDLATNYPSIASTFVLGTTYEGRNILGLKVRANQGATQEFFFNGGIHSREWIAHATVLYMANELVTKYGGDSNVTELVNSLDFTIVPILNPDGYVYTWGGDRLWRKNRQPNSGTTCVGTDLNRNWAYQWNTGGSSPLPCSESYHGTAPNSSPETSAIANYLSTNRARLAGYIDFHAYGQLLMFPWGYTTGLTPDHSALLRVGNAGAAALRVPYSTVYDVGSIANIIYVASGSSADYAYGALDVTWSFAFELRGNSFVIAPTNIIPSGIETFEALKAICREGPLRN